MYERQLLLDLWQSTRAQTLAIVEPLNAEDFSIQAMDDTSPPKWHLAHTTWFFEHFLLVEHCPDYIPDDDLWSFLFNSYYQSVGKPYARPRRGLLARPTIDEVLRYRQNIDEQLLGFLTDCSEEVWAKIEIILETGIHHEKQHQELLLMDIKYNFFSNPLYPAYAKVAHNDDVPAVPQEWFAIAEGIQEIGAPATGFAYDNERPRHKVYLAPAALASRPATQAEYLEFMHAGGYENPAYWLSDGWDFIQQHQKIAPLYWLQIDRVWQTFTLYGLQPLRGDLPVSHLTYYEADAFARWAKARLPTEAEWEIAARDIPVAGNLQGLEPKVGAGDAPLLQIYGDVWEWTSSAYSAYPGFQPLQGALGEYNGKFMINQYVLRGGSAATPLNHTRVSYRNFFYPQCAWQFSGVRLARDC